MVGFPTRSQDFIPRKLKRECRVSRNSIERGNSDAAKRSKRVKSG